jgi:hypothetical protein
MADAAPQQEPPFDLTEYWHGTLNGWGMIQGWGGKILSRFDITFEGSWQGSEGVLREDYRYYSGATETRIWQIRALADGGYEATAPDIIGVARGQSDGAMVRFRYRLRLPLGKRQLAVTVDDRMWRLHDGVVINRSRMKKFGIPLAYLTVFMQKSS